MRSVSRVDVVRRGPDGGEVRVVSARLAGGNVLLFGKVGDIRTVLRDVLGGTGCRQTDGRLFLNALRLAYAPSLATAYGAWTAVRP